MNKISVIDLLNKLANGEEVPKKIKWGVHEFRWFVYEYKSIGELSEPTLLDYLSQAPHMLNDEIEIIEDTPKKIEKLHNEIIDANRYTGDKSINYFSADMKDVCNKINEIIDFLNNME